MYIIYTGISDLDPKTGTWNSDHTVVFHNTSYINFYLLQDEAEVFETVQLLGQSVAKLFTVATQATDRCIKLTNGCCCVGLLQALKVESVVLMLTFIKCETGLYFC